MSIAYKIATLVYLFNPQGQTLLLHRSRFPNKDLFSPIGGKLEQQLGESPYACALRELHEEVGLKATLDDIRLVGIVSEKAYAAADSADVPTHWLMFCFEVVRALDIAPPPIPEGRLEWVDIAAVESLPIPRTDREIIWPLVRKHSQFLNRTDPQPASREIFSVHIDCTAGGFISTLEHPRPE